MLRNKCIKNFFARTQYLHEQNISLLTKLLLGSLKLYISSITSENIKVSNWINRSLHKIFHTSWWGGAFANPKSTILELYLKEQLAIGRLRISIFLLPEQVTKVTSPWVLWIGTKQILISSLPQKIIVFTPVYFKTEFGMVFTVLESVRSAATRSFSYWVFYTKKYTLTILMFQPTLKHSKILQNNVPRMPPLGKTE